MNPVLLALAILTAGLGGVVLLGWLLVRPRLVLTILLLLLPFHTGLFQILKIELALPTTIALALQSWKEGTLLLLVSWVLVQSLTTGRLRMAHAWILPLVGLFMLIGLAGIRHAPSFVEGLYSYRVMFEPFVVFLLILLLPLDIAWCKRLVPWLLVVGAIVAALAIFQAIFLGYDFLWKYYAADGQISVSFSFMGGRIQRAMGTFSSPNQLSLYLVFIILITANLALRFPQQRRRLATLLALLFAALLLTVSRSGWVALLVGLGFSFLIWRRKRIVVPLFILLALIAIPIGSTLGLGSHLANTLQGRELSANYHIMSFRQNVEVILDNPLGVGLGRVGPRAFYFRKGSGQFYPTESYLLQVAMELGIPGLVMFLLVTISAAIVVYSNIFRLSSVWSRAMAVSALAALLAALAHTLLIPDLQDFTLGCYLWFLVAWGMRLPALEQRISPV